MAYKDTDYMYASARVRALEAKLLTPEKYMQIIEASGRADAVALLSDSMTPLYAEDGAFDLEATLDTFLTEVFTLIRSIAPDPTLFAFLQYEFDANNLKAAVKALYRGVPADDMLFECASVAREKAVSAVRDKDFSAFPKHMALAAAKAMEEYGASGDPQIIDLLIDRASFADMLDAVQGEPLLEKIVRKKIDTANVLAALRLIDAGVKNGLNTVFVAGGEVPKDLFLKAGDREALVSALKFSAASSLAEVMDADKSIPLGVLEREADNLLLGTIKEAKFVSFGLPVLCGYLFAALYEAKNLRIIFALRALGERGESIRERMRASYV